MCSKINAQFIRTITDTLGGGVEIFRIKVVDRLTYARLLRHFSHICINSIQLTNHNSQQNRMYFSAPVVRSKGWPWYRPLGV